MKEQGHFPKNLGKHFAGVFAVLTIAGCDAPIPQTKNPTFTPTPITRTSTQEILPQTNEQIIQEEVKRLGIEVSGTEGRLWHNFGYSYSIEKKPINETTLQEATNRVQSTISLMEQSESPYFSTAANYILPLLSSGVANIAVYDQIGKTGSAMVTGAYLISKDNSLQIHWHIKISANEVLNNSSGPTLALQLAHEIEHVRNMIEFQNSLPHNLSPQERLQKEYERYNNPQEYLNEEARGYRVQAQAYIVAYGLGFRGGRGLSHETYAAEFIRGGNDPDSAYWKNFIKQELMGTEKTSK